MKQFVLMVLSFVLLGSTALQAYGKNGVRISNEFGDRLAEQFDFVEHRKKRKTVRKSNPRYVYLTLQKASSKTVLEQIEQKGNLKIHSLAQVHIEENGVKFPIYLVRCHAGIEYSLDALSRGGFDDVVYAISPMEHKDRVSKKIFENRGFSKKEMAGERKIFALVQFFPDVSRNVADSLIRVYSDTVTEVTSNGQKFSVIAEPLKLLQLSRLEVTMLVRERVMGEEPVNYDGRALLRVDETQQFDMQAIPFPPVDTPYWSPNTSFTGEGISVDVYDTGIDSMKLDFREWNSQSGVTYNSGMSHQDILDNTMLRLQSGGGVMCLPNYDDADYNRARHGTHVAGTIGGNGWGTPSSIGRYLYRGMAPKVKFYSFVGQWPLERFGNVSNHSHVHSDLNWYTTNHAITDMTIFNNRSKTVVSAAGNNGLSAQYGYQKGYYSLTANAKNYITVGAVYSSMLHQGYPLRTEFSSMGPTRDGRIKPDVMGPGDSHIFPLRSAERPMIVEFDSIAIIGTSGNVKVSWGFRDGAMGWSGYKIQNVSANTGILRYEDVGQGSYIWSDSTYKSVGAAPKCELNDTLLFSYRVNIPSQEQEIDELNIRFYWRVNDNTYHRGYSQFHVPVSSQVFNTVKVSLGNIVGDWKVFYSDAASDDDLVSIRFDIQGAGGGGVLSTAFHNDGDGYVRMPGTSMAAPHVTGVVALMLEKYKRYYLGPLELPVAEHAFWNSTAKALLIHTATDMVKTVPYDGETPNPDTFEPLVYHKGPDYATGWGMVNAEKAVAHVDTNVFKQDSVDQGQVITYTFTKAESGNSRVSLVWDDYAALGGNSFYNVTNSKLINNLDLHVIDPFGVTHLPWVLESLPQPPEIFIDSLTFAGKNGIDPITSADTKPAGKGVDNINNVEVVDIENAPSGEYTVVITGTELGMPLQHFSLVADNHLEKVSVKTPPRTGLIMGFESDTLWSIVYSSGTLSSSAVKTEGDASLEISGNGWQQIKSKDINTEELHNVTNNISVDLFVGATQTNPYWTGQVQLFVNCPSAGVYNQHINTVDLTGFPLDVFSTVSFTFPPEIVEILNGRYSDFSFSLSINTNVNTWAYYFDNMRFEN